MNAITPIDANPLVPRSMDEAVRLAELMAKAKMVPQHLQGDVGTCLMVVEQALRWRMSPFAVAQCTSNIRGRLMFEGKLIAAAVEAMGGIVGGFDYDFSGEGDDRKIVVKARRPDDANPRQITVRLGDVKTTNEWWTKQPDQQLVYSATRAWARRWTPAAILGVYAPEEFAKGADDFQGQTLEGVATGKPEHGTALVVGIPAPGATETQAPPPASSPPQPTSVLPERAPPVQTTQPTHAEPKPNGNGKTRTIKDWLDEFRRDCEAAATKDAAEEILKRAPVVDCRRMFATMPRVIEEIERTRQEMIDRFWSHTEEDAEMSLP